MDWDKVAAVEFALERWLCGHCDLRSCEPCRRKFAMSVVMELQKLKQGGIVPLKGRSHHVRAAAALNASVELALRGRIVSADMGAP